MPVRIYDISKKLGLENKEVLAKAKELGIAAARVASSSLDKITAEYLEQQLVIAYPDRAPQAPATATPSPTPEPASTPALPDSLKLVTASPPELPEVQIQEITPITTLSGTVLEAPAAPTPSSPAPVEAPAAKPAPESVPMPAIVEPTAKTISQPPPSLQRPAAPPAPAP